MGKNLKIVTFNVRQPWDYPEDGVNSFIHRAGMVLTKIDDEKPDICYGSAGLRPSSQTADTGFLLCTADALCLQYSPHRSRNAEAGEEKGGKKAAAGSAGKIYPLSDTCICFSYLRCGILYKRLYILRLPVDTYSDHSGSIDTAGDIQCQSVKGTHVTGLFSGNTESVGEPV